MDTFDDSSTLPELSFDDLLDPSPVKKNGRSSAGYDDDDPLEVNTETRITTKRDESLNTPGSKKSYQIIMHSGGRPSRPITNSSISTKPTPMRANPMKPGNIVGSAPMKTVSSTAGANPPILLNTKNVLPKTATPITNNSIKITQKSISSAGGNGISTGSGGGGGTSNVSLVGKTAVRTSTGQLIYIQKTSSSASTPASSAIKTSQGTNIAVKTSAAKVTSSTLGSGSKPMTIQVMRAADGSFVPVKPNATGSVNKNTTLTLSPTATLAGKRLVTTSGGQVVLKSQTMSTVTSTNSSVSAIVKPTTTTSTSESPTSEKRKTIFVQGSNGKQILVQNSSLVKLSPHTQSSSSGSTNTGTQSATAAAAGQNPLQSMQLSGKTGFQYVRVLPVPSKVNISNSMALNSSIATKTTTAASSSAATTHTTSATTGQVPVKILNNLPQKFTVLQKGTSTKLVLTQKKDLVTGDFAPVASKVHKTIVTVPTSKSIIDDKTKTPPSAHQTLMNQNQTLVRKHKISEINTELKRITTSESEENGPPEVKKSIPNSRLVVISSNNAPKLLNTSLQQAGRITTLNTSGGGMQVQGTKLQTTSNASTSSATNAITTSTSGGQTKQLYTILKPSTGQSQQPQNQAKALSVLKPVVETSRPTTSATIKTQSSETSSGKYKTLINKQSLQQQQKIYQLVFQKPKSSSATSLSSSLSSSPYTTTTTITPASTFLPIKIKEEPIEDLDLNESTVTTTSLPYLVSSSFAAPKPPAPAPLPVAPPAVEDPNKIDLVGSVVRRKHCNCSKSQCLKLYCDCFANGEFCQDCTCKDCCNNLENEDERQKAIKSCLERNPSAFKPKITSSSDQGDMRLHNKGCNCKRSGCLKNYCECYEAKIPCSSNCKCVGCRNVEDRADLDMDPINPKLMASLASTSNSAAGPKRTYAVVPNVPIKTEKYAREIIKTEPGVVAMPLIDRPQCNFITQEVVDATIQCMITQADECQKNSLPAHLTEKMIMEELGRCLVEIIDFSIRNTDASYGQD